MADDLVDALRPARPGEYHGGKFVDKDGLSLVVTLHSDTIRTLDDAIAEAQIDLRQWRVQSHQITKWDQGQKINVDGKDRVAAIELWSVRMKLERVCPEYIIESLDWLHDQWKNIDIRPVKRLKRRADGERELCVPCFYDVHMGMYAWSAEAGDDYDCNIATERIANATADMLYRARNQNIAKVLIPIGQDFFHADNWRGTTHNGTPLDVDTRGKRVFRIGCAAMARVINQFRRVAPVEFVYSPGNHDTSISWYLTEWLAAIFRDAEDVTYIDNDETFSFHKFGETLIGLNHGDAIPAQRLAGMMPVKARDMWATTSYWEWLTGHKHKRNSTNFKGCETHDGIVVRIVPSLSANDYWHNMKGFNTSRRAADCYFYGEESGLVAMATANARG